ncbi:phage tail tip fiber protein, partial [Comamonas testosteroni]|uniref:phage tail tip fiber protein n=2 Tax=Comamonas testosteroni TaxID=285 RepID=UPI0012D76F48
MQAAQSASDAAGGKGKVIFGSSQPAVGDRLPQNLWIDTAGGANTPKRWSGTAWIVVTDKAATDAAAAAAAAQAKADEASAAIVQESQTRATAIEAEASQRQQLQATVGSNHTAAMQAAQAASDAAGSKGKVLYGTSAPAVADRLAQNLWIDTTGGANTPKRWNGSAWAAVTDKAATDAAAAAATAQSTANNAVAAIQTEQSVRANETGHLGALYSVRMQLSQGGQQVVGGFALSGTSNGTAGPTIDFGVMANSFWIAAPAGSPAGVSNVKPFSVQTTEQTINGVVVPAGVYMDAAYINNVTVLFGRFGTLLADKIQATAISASQLTAGNGVIGGTLKSSNYMAGSSGWTLRPDGVAELSGVIVR